MKPQFLPLLILNFVILISFQACTKSQKEKAEETNASYEKGTFGYDLNFLKKHYDDLVVLEDGEAGMIISPALQGRVMTSTMSGANGQSFGWINYDYIAAGKMSNQFNPTGGEERFWVGPEGGQFSLFFDQNKEFGFDNWRVPKEIDTEPFNLLRSDGKSASFQKSMQLTNYSGTVFDLEVKRTIRLLDDTEMVSLLGIDLPDDVRWVGFESENTIANKGKNNWDKTTGMPSVWILSMLLSSDATWVIVPFVPGDEKALGKIVTDDYFGKVPTDRLIVKDSVLFFRADGKKRSKIGLSPQRSLPVAGSYDVKNKVLTIAQFTKPEDNTHYVNSLWEIQDEPFAGDAFNAYNDGPLENGSQLGPFYELESSSPAAALAPGQALIHFHRTFHFTGNPDALNEIIRALLHTSISEIENNLTGKSTDQ